MSDLPGLIVDVEARIDKLEKGLKRANAAQNRASGQMEARAQRSADKLRTTYGKAGDSILATFKRLGPGLVAGLSVGALAGLTRNIGQVVKEVASIGDAAKTAGVDIEAFQELKFVGDQNRIGIDAMTDGLKELSLRADEFVVTGGGPAAESFRRLNLSASQLAEGLKKPDILFEDIIRKMEGLDDAAQIRIADEVFGGTAAEQFSALISKGADALRATRQEARDTGTVLDSAVISKAAELDRRYAALQTRVDGFWKSFAVGAADAAVKVATLRTDLDDLFRSYQQADGLLGKGAADALRADSDAAGENADQIAALRRQYEALGDVADNTGASLMQAAATLRQLGYNDVADQLLSAADEMLNLTGKMQDGTISADEFERQMQAAADTAQTALGEIDAIDSATFGNVIAQVGGLIARLGEAAAKARELRASLPGATVDGGTDTPPASPSGPTSRNGHRAATPGLAVTNSIRPQLPSVDASFGSPEPDNGGGGQSAGGGGSARQNDLQREIAAIQEETAALTLQASEIAKVTGARGNHADALELARTKAELLAAAQRAGVEVTPQLATQIDTLAQGYVAAGTAADKAADKIREIQEASAQGAQALTDVFMGMASGATTAEQALAQLVLQLIKMETQKRLMAMADSAGGSVFGKVLGFLGGGFSEGGWTGPGSKDQPAGIVHSDEFVMSKKAVRAIGVPTLEALHQSAIRGYSGGGLVGAARSSSVLPMARSGASTPSIEINSPITVNASGGTPEQNADLAKKMAREMEQSMRTVVVSELSRQLRPGAMLSRKG
ncbi:MAG: hypothetical protein ABJG14_11055 [Sulfitobacter sp.]|uniref:hypothetical protein n=1 Tax=Alphaproteobacteria TaxID=28211 RepID=UPI003266179C